MCITKRNIDNGGHIMKNLTDRRSGVELLKIIAIFLIVISHVTQSLENESLQSGIIHLGQATTDIQILILTLLRQAGALGNNIFFISSAWF